MNIMIMREAIRRITQSMIAVLILGVGVLISGTSAHAVEVERVISEKGVEAWLVRDHSNPIVTMEFKFLGGGALDPSDKQGLAALAAATIDEGAGDLDSTAFQTALDDRSITLSFSAGLDSFRGTFRTLNKHRDYAFELARLALTEARFDEEPVDRIRTQLVSRVKQNSQSPNYRASRKILEIAFGGHPYAQPSNGTVEGLTAITRDNLRAFTKNRFARDTLIIGVVGDITADELKVYLDKTFGGLPAKATSTGVPEIMAALSGGITVIDVDVPQSSIQFGHAGISRDDPDFYTAHVLNYILGGGSFVSRLYQQVREERGLAYSVYSYLMPLDSSAAVMGGAGTANERVKETVDVIRDVWQEFAANGPTQQELNDAKTYLTGAFPLRFTSSSTIANMLVAMQNDNLGIDYIDKRNSYIEAVTLEDAKRVANQLYQPEKLSFVIAGKPVGISATE
jgi:zinc protease